MKFAFVIAALFAASAIAAPCGRKHVDDVADTPDMPQVDETLATTTPTTEEVHDVQDNSKSSSNDSSDDAQTAVINNNSPDKGGKGSLIGVDASNLLAGGVLANTKNEIKQKGN